ncbi:hypothetical protein ACXDF8_20050 [Mycolicibacterium sp. CBM1]
MKFAQSSRLSSLSHEMPGPIGEHATRFEAEGHAVVRLDTGDPYPFGFDSPRPGMVLSAPPREARWSTA